MYNIRRYIDIITRNIYTSSVCSGRDRCNNAIRLEIRYRLQRTQRRRVLPGTVLSPILLCRYTPARCNSVEFSHLHRTSWFNTTPVPPAAARGFILDRAIFHSYRRRKFLFIITFFFPDQKKIHNGVVPRCKFYKYLSLRKVYTCIKLHIIIIHCDDAQEIYFFFIYFFSYKHNKPLRISTVLAERLDAALLIQMFRECPLYRVRLTRRFKNMCRGVRRHCWSELVARQDVRRFHNVLHSKQYNPSRTDAAKKTASSRAGEIVP